MAGNTVRITATTKDNASSGLDRIRDKAERLQKQGAKGFAIGAGAAITAKGLSMVDAALSSTIQFVGDSINKARDLNETMTKSGVVFGESAGEISRWGDKADKAMGMSKNAAVGAAAGFGDLFNKMEETRDRSVEMSTGLVALSSDLASFHNLAGGSAEALEKLQSGLAGETEPLRRLGVFLNEAKVQAKASALGFQEVNGKFTEGAKIAARYALIMEETASAHGNFAATSKDLAQQQRIANGTLDDAQAKLGAKLVPAMLMATEKGIELIDTITGIADAVESLAQKAPGGASALDMLLRTADPSKWLDVNGAAEAYLDTIQSMGFDTAKAREEFRRLGLDVETAGEQASAGLGQYADAAFRAKVDSQLAEHRARELGDAIEVVGDKAKTTSKKVSRSLEDIVDDFTTARDRLQTLGNQAADAIYDPIIAKGELAAVEREISEQKQIIASKKSTRAQVRDAKARMVELNKRRTELVSELASHNKLTSKEITKELRSLGREYGKASREARYQILLWMNALAELARAQARARIGTGRASRSGPLEMEFRAGGGPVEANRPYVVGEGGKKEIFVPKVAGHIIDGNRTAQILSPRMGTPLGFGGGAMVLNVTVNAAPGMTPGQAREIGEAFGPAVYDWMRRKQKVA